MTLVPSIFLLTDFLHPLDKRPHGHGVVSDPYILWLFLSSWNYSALPSTSTGTWCSLLFIIPRWQNLRTCIGYYVLIPVPLFRATSPCKLSARMVSTCCWGLGFFCATPCVTVVLISSSLPCVTLSITPYISPTSRFMDDSFSGISVRFTMFCHPSILVNMSCHISGVFFFGVTVVFWALLLIFLILFVVKRFVFKVLSLVWNCFL